MTADHVNLQPIEFRPTQAPAIRRGPRFTKTQLLLGSLALVAAFVIWFIFTAKSVRLEFTPVEAVPTISGGFQFAYQDIYLLRRGEYSVQATAVGYHPLDTVVTVGSERSQTRQLTLEKLPGRITFESNPPGATVFVDDVEVGTTPLTTDVLAGTRQVLVTAPRYQDTGSTLEVEGLARAQSLSLTLAPNWADVTVPTEPAGATVRVDGEPVELLTPGPFRIDAGERRIELKLAGYKTWADILFLQAEQQVELPRVVLEEAAGLVRVTSKPVGAGLTVGGRFLGTTPTEIALTPGRRHTVRALKVGFTAATRTVDVAAQQESSLHFDLQPLIGKLDVKTQPEDVELWVDGKRQPTANTVLSLSALPHEIEIKKDGYAGYRKRVTPQPGFTQELRVKLLTHEAARMAALKPVMRTSLGQELVLLQPDTIAMGASRREPGRRANEVIRTARFNRLFYLARKEVTNKEFRAFAAGHAAGEFEQHDLNGDDQPAVKVSWQDAALFCNWLSRREKLQPFYTIEYGKLAGFDSAALGYRLPSEAEWAWAARAQDGGDPLRFPWGDRLPPPDKQGNYADRAAAHVVGRIVFSYNDNHIVSAPVGTFARSARGLYDIGGNVAEWAHDFYAIPEATETLNDLGPSSGEYHVIRGSSWMHGTVTDLRLSFRDYGTEGRPDVGFRIARYAE